jgi:tetratricopeptide (TPR) repeat protein
MRQSNRVTPQAITMAHDSASTGKHLRYRPTVVPVDWELPELQPKIAIAQLRATYRSNDANDSRVRHAEDSAYGKRLFEALSRALESDAHFVVFPEYSWPYRLRTELLEFAQKNLPVGAAWLLPFEHLRLEEFRSLLATMPVPPTLRDETLDDLTASLGSVDASSSYVNVCVTLLRSGDEIVAIPQTKTRGAALEERQLLGAKHIYIVQGRNCRFTTFICFDIIARDESRSERPREAIVVPGATLDLVFIPECNPSPLHHSYARAAIDLFEEPELAPSVPWLVFANVAVGSSHPGIHDANSFGFSRIVGRLGEVATSENVAFVHDGVIAADNASSLKEVASPRYRIPLPGIRSLFARPQESLLVATLPRLHTGPSRDPAVGRANSSFVAFRWVGTWQRVRASVRHPARNERWGVPQRLLVSGGLIGAASLEKELRDVIASSASPVWVCGQGGIGKTALVAAVLEPIERRGTARVLWIDLAEVEHEARALLEHLLIKLGLPAGLRETPDAQHDLLRAELDRTPTILVLDSRELWKVDALPTEVLGLHKWPSRVLVTARNMPDPGATFGAVEVPPLTREGSAELIRRGAPADLDAATIDALARFAEGSPLACAWIAGALSTSSSGIDAAQAATGSPEGALGTVFLETTKRLNNAEREILLILSCLPHAVAEADLSDIAGLSVDRLRSTIAELENRHLVLTASRDEGVHAAHPFVRQFVMSWTNHSDVPGKLRAWADRTLQERGGDRNWSAYPRLNELWPNLRSILELTAANAPEEYLRLWRRSDYFLWSSGRLRERERLGLKAIDLARKANRLDDLTHALVDSVAECRWHTSGTEPACSALLDEAETIAKTMTDPSGRLAMIECYRSRMHRHFNNVDEAEKAAHRAVALAKACNDVLVIGLCVNALGNVHRSRRDWDGALGHFSTAADCFSRMSEREMMAIVLRNQGRCHQGLGRHGDAIAAFEEAVEILRTLNLDVECAEVALDHAQALHDVGEHEEGRAEAIAAKELFANLGALHLIKAADDLLKPR